MNTLFSFACFYTSYKWEPYVFFNFAKYNFYSMHEAIDGSFSYIVYIMQHL